MVNRSDILHELLDQSSEVSGNRSNFRINGSLDEYSDQSAELNLSDIFHQMRMYSSLVIIPIGIMLNILCLIIFVKSKISQSPTGLTLTYLAVADIIVIIPLFNHSTESLSQYINIPSIITTSSLVCKLNMYFINVGFFLSGLLLAYSTIERYVSVRFALQVKSWNLYFKTKILLVLYFIAAFGFSSFALLCYDVIPLDSDRCLASHKYEQFCYVSEITVNSVLSNGLCTLLIFIFTILTSTELFTMKKKRAEMGKESTKEFGITVMLVMVAILFLILRTPEMIIFQMMSHFMSNNMAGPVVENAFAVWPLSIILVTLNHSINFIIYSIFLKKFRDTFFSFFICIKLKCQGPGRDNNFTEQTRSTGVRSSGSLRHSNNVRKSQRSDEGKF